MFRSIFDTNTSNGKDAYTSSPQPAASSSSSSNSLRPSDDSIDRLCMNLEIAGVLTGEDKQKQIDLLSSNGWDWLRAAEAYFAEQEEVEDTNQEEEDGYNNNNTNNNNNSNHKPSFHRAATAAPAASSSAAAASSSSDVTPDELFITVRSDSHLEVVYKRKADQKFQKVFAEFTSRSNGRSLEFLYQGKLIQPDQTPRMLRMTSTSAQIDARAPVNKKRQFSLAHGPEAAAAAAAAIASPSVAHLSNGSDGPPNLKRAKSDPISDQHAASSIEPSPLADELDQPPVTPFRATWSEILLGTLTFTLAHPNYPLDDKGTLASKPISIYSSLLPFIRDMNKNQWRSSIREPPMPDLTEQKESSSPEQLHPLQVAWEKEFQNALTLNDRIVSALSSWATKSHAMKCFIKLLSTDEVCGGRASGQCRNERCGSQQHKSASNSSAHKCGSPRTLHSFHISISLLPGSNNEQFPYANEIFPMLHPEFETLIARALPRRSESIPNGKMELGNLLELSVRVRFNNKHCVAASTPDPCSMVVDDDAAPMRRTRVGGTRKKNGVASSSSASSSGAAAGASSSNGAIVSPLTEHERVRVGWGLKPREETEDDEDDEDGEGYNNDKDDDTNMQRRHLNQLRRMSPELLSQASHLNLTLRDYQQQTVLWSMKQELSTSIAEPYWEPIELISGQTAYYSPYFQTIRFEPLPSIVGGMVSEEMGLGKTIEMLALIHLNPARHDENNSNYAQPASSSSASAFSIASPAPSMPAVGSRTAAGRIISGATLIIVPTSLVGQWMSEIVKHSSRRLHVSAWYGPGRIRDPVKVAQHDIILTTFGIIESEFRSGKGGVGGGGGGGDKKSLLEMIEWHRIIVDESHQLKNKAARTTLNVIRISSRRRWLLTGTPLTTQVDDIMNQFEFFRMVPIRFNDARLVQSIRRNVFGIYTGGGRDLNDVVYTPRLCFELLIRMFTKTIIRHKKNQPFNDRSTLIALPKRVMDIIPIHLTPSERNGYQHLRTFVRAQFSEFQRMNQVVAKTLQILQLLTPLLQACSAGCVNTNDIREKLRLIQEVAEKEKADDAKKKSGQKLETNTEENQPFNDPRGECSVCLDIIEEALMTICRHVYCTGCIKGAIRTNGECPLCRSPANIKDLRPPPPPPPEIKPPAAAAAASASSSGSLDGSMMVDDDDSVDFTTKVNVLVEQLQLIRGRDSKTKSLIFSRFASTMRIVEERSETPTIIGMSRHKASNIWVGFGVVVLSGSLSAPQRKSALDRFINDDECTIFILSIRSGGVGLTLTAAQHVWLMEPQQNPALTLQAINRVHRVGQTKDCFIHHLIVVDSIEERMMEMTKAKLQTVVDDEGEEDPSAAGRHSRAKTYRMKLEELTRLFE